VLALEFLAPDLLSHHQSGPKVEFYPELVVLPWLVLAYADVMSSRHSSWWAYEPLAMA
jgi:hypothetical protein